MQPRKRSTCVKRQWGPSQALDATGLSAERG